MREYEAGEERTWDYPGYPDRYYCDEDGCDCDEPTLTRCPHWKPSQRLCPGCAAYEEKRVMLYVNEEGQEDIFMCNECDCKGNTNQIGSQAVEFLMDLHGGGNQKCIGS